MHNTCLRSGGPPGVPLMALGWHVMVLPLAYFIIGGGGGGERWEV